MAENEETLLMAGKQTPEVPKKNEGTRMKPSNSWKKITFGTTSGILLGAGAIYAVSTYGKNDENELTDNVVKSQSENIKVAKVDDGLSFSDAFNEAREQVGPGGVFRWHGGLYGTYNEKEWEALSDADKADYAQTIRPEIRADEIVTERISEEHPDVVGNTTANGEIADNAEGVHVVPQSISEQGNELNACDDQTTYETDDGVHIVGQGTVEGHAAVAVDVTGNGEADVAVIDINDNCVIDDPDVVIDREGNYATMGQIADAQDNQNSEEGIGYASNDINDATDPNMQQTAYENPDLSPDMPDYMDDADVSDTLV